MTDRDRGGCCAPAPVPVGATELLDSTGSAAGWSAPSCPAVCGWSPRRARVAQRPLGVWVGVGSVDETPRLAGASHYLEHLLFKGTTTRTALEIATAMDAVGGELNAFTSHEYTCYYANVLAERPAAGGRRWSATWCSRRHHRRPTSSPSAR